MVVDEPLGPLRANPSPLPRLSGCCRPERSSVAYQSLMSVLVTDPLLKFENVRGVSPSPRPSGQVDAMTIEMVAASRPESIRSRSNPRTFFDRRLQRDPNLDGGVATMTFWNSKGLTRAGSVALIFVFVASAQSTRPIYAQTGAEGTPGAAKAGTTTPGATSKGDAKASCQRYLGILAGRQQDGALLHNAEAQSIARLAPDLTTCGAVARDSDEPCNLLGDPEKNACRGNRGIYHELRKSEKRVSIFGDVVFEDCRADKQLAPYCETLRAATRSGDAKKCPPQNLGAYCRAAIALDPSLCKYTGTDTEGPQRDCVKTVEKLKSLAPGLKGLAKSGPSPDREFAKAALGEADACAPYEQKAMDACVANLTKPVESPTAGPASAPNPPTAPPATPGSN